MTALVCMLPQSGLQGWHYKGDSNGQYRMGQYFSGSCKLKYDLDEHVFLHKHP